MRTHCRNNGADIIQRGTRQARPRVLIGLRACETTGQRKVVANGLRERVVDDLEKEISIVAPEPVLPCTRFDGGPILRALACPENS